MLMYHAPSQERSHDPVRESSWTAPATMIVTTATRRDAAHGSITARHGSQPGRPRVWCSGGPVGVAGTERVADGVAVTVCPRRGTSAWSAIVGWRPTARRDRDVTARPPGAGARRASPRGAWR